MSETTNEFEMAQRQFDQVAELLKLDPQVREILRWPLREFAFRIPVRMDDGTIRVFQGFRVQHNDARGPNKGGIRFHPAETLDMCVRWVPDDLENAQIVDIPLGGGKGGVVVDPATLSAVKKNAWSAAGCSQCGAISVRARRSGSGCRHQIADGRAG